MPASRMRSVAQTSIAIEEQQPVSADPGDRSVTVALAAAVREALTRKRWLSVVDAPGPIPTWREGSAATIGPRYLLRLALFRRREDPAAHGVEAYRNEPSALGEHDDRRLGADVFGIVDELASSVVRWLDREYRGAETTVQPNRPQSRRVRMTTCCAPFR